MLAPAVDRPRVRPDGRLQLHPLTLQTSPTGAVRHPASRWIVTGSTVGLCRAPDGWKAVAGLSADHEWLAEHDLPGRRFRTRRQLLDVLSALHAADPIPA